MNENMETEAFTKVFAAWLKALRNRLSLTQAELAGLLGVRAEPVSRWENERELPVAYNMVRIMGFATPDERTALVEKAMIGIDDNLKEDVGLHLRLIQCDDCGQPLRVRDFTAKGWPAPLLVRDLQDPYAVRLCVRCTSMP
jgi:transcriptional regulator with XRE-family HTH domain